MPASPTSCSRTGACAARARTCCSLYPASTGRLKRIDDGSRLVFPPPPIQGIGNAGGFTMQVELRDGSFDWPSCRASAGDREARADASAALQRVDAARSAPTCRSSTWTIDRVKAETLRRHRWAMCSRRSAPISAPPTSGSSTSSAACSRSTCRRIAAPPAAGGHREADGAQQQRRHGSARNAGRDHAGGRALADQPVQSLSRRNGHWRCRPRASAPGEAHRAAGADRRPRRCRRMPASSGRPCRTRRRTSAIRSISSSRWPAAGVSGAGRPVRELVRAGDRASWRCRWRCWARSRALTALGYGQQPLYADRAGAADRALGQERDPDRGGGARAARARRHGRSWRRRSRRHAPASGRS